MYGIVPDGVASVDLSWDGGGAGASVQDNAYSIKGVDPRGPVHVEPSGAAEGCTPSAAAYDAAPALRLAAEGTPPKALDTGMQELGSGGEWLAHARHATTRTGLELWVAPEMPCDGAQRERVCLLPEGGSLLCETLEHIAERGAWNQAGDVVAGFAPAGARVAEVRTAGSNDVALVAVEHGVFGTDGITGKVTSVRMR